MNDIHFNFLSLVTSTGLIAVADKKTYLFYDKFSGFVKGRSGACEFYNNLHLDLRKERRVDLYQLFYLYPLYKAQIHLSQFFRALLDQYHNPCFCHELEAFIWDIGIIDTNKEFVDAEREEILIDMRKIHGKNFVPED